MSKTANDVKFVLRLPDKLHRYIRTLAAREHSSMNSTLIRVIDEHAHPEHTLPILFERLEEAGVIPKQSNARDQ